MRNQSTLDRVIRLILSLALFQLAYFWLPGGWQILGFAVAIIVLVTASLGICPLYHLIGSRPNDRRHRDRRPHW